MWRIRSPSRYNEVKSHGAERIEKEKEKEKEIEKEKEKEKEKEE